ncbi:MAG: multi-sensor signal transduction histidine kinase, partial [uncultured bacterium]
IRKNRKISDSRREKTQEKRLPVEKNAGKPDLFKRPKSSQKSNALTPKNQSQVFQLTRVGKLTEFVSSLTHEISQPLTAILSYAQAAKRMLGGREPKVQEILQYIINDDLRAAEVIQRFRTLLKTGESEINPLDINALIDETVLFIAVDAKVRNISIKIELERNLPFIRGDRIQLQQVFLNLISNSFDALEGIPFIREIFIRTFLKNTETIQVEVTDTGCGIPKHNISNLFARFFTTKTDGLGLGLYISRAIVEMHEGVLNVKNNAARGVTFYFTLPASKKANP